MLSLLLLAALSGPSLANRVIALAPHNLYPRQDQSFTPPTSIENGCASDEVQCPGEFDGTPYCITPSRGDVCCAQGCKYTDSATSFDQREESSFASWMPNSEMTDLSFSPLTIPQTVAPEMMEGASA